jgi:hypothetical protein
MHTIGHRPGKSTRADHHYISYERKNVFRSWIKSHAQIVCLNVCTVGIKNEFFLDILKLWYIFSWSTTASLVWPESLNIISILCRLRATVGFSRKSYSESLVENGQSETFPTTSSPRSVDEIASRHALHVWHHSYCAMFISMNKH